MSKKKQPLPVAEKTEAELAFIIETIENCAALPDAIKSFIIICIENALWFPDVLQRKNISMKRLKFMLFGKSYKSTEKTNSENPLDSTLIEDKGNETANTDATQSVVDFTPATMTTMNTGDIEAIVKNSFASGTKTVQKINAPASGHGRMAHTAYKDYVEITLNIEDLKPGDPCPLDCGGKVYPFTPKMPKTLLRIVGQKMAEVRKIKVERLRCNLCHYLIQAKIPAWVGAEKYDAAFKAWIVLQKYRVAVPFYRQEGFQRLLDFPLSDATQWSLVEKVAGFCYRIFDVLTLLAANSDLLYLDDTRLKIQAVIQEIKKASNAKRTGMFTTGFLAEHEGYKIALFLNGTRHAGENVTSLLSKRMADKPPIIQMCDALSANVSKAVSSIICNCLSHGFRKFEEIVDMFPTPCMTIMKLLSPVYDNDAKTKGISTQARLEYHQQHSKPAIELLERYMKALFDEKLVEPNSELGKALKYMQKHWQKLTRFLSVAGAPLCNNILERALKIAILNRKNAMFYRTCYSAQVGGMLTSIIYTCELNQVNAYDYLIGLQTHAAAVNHNPQQWLPWNYKENRSAHVNEVACANQQEFAPDRDVLAAG